MIRGGARGSWQNPRVGSSMDRDAAESDLQLQSVWFSTLKMLMLSLERPRSGRYSTFITSSRVTTLLCVMFCLAGREGGRRAGELVLGC